MSDTAPQPPPVEQPVQTLARLLEEAGAIPVICGIPLNTTLEERITLLLDRIAALEAELAEAQERLASAVEAAYGAACEDCKRGDAPKELNDVITANGRPYWHEILHHDGTSSGSFHVCGAAAIRQALALTATAPAVAQFVAGVERRGAKAALEAFAERDDWTLDVPRSLVDRIRRLLTEAACAAELEGA